MNNREEDDSQKMAVGAFLIGLTLLKRV